MTPTGQSKGLLSSVSRDKFESMKIVYVYNV